MPTILPADTRSALAFAGTPIGRALAKRALENPNGWESASTRCRRGDVRAPRFTFVNQGARRSAQPRGLVRMVAKFTLVKQVLASTRVSTGDARP